MAKAKKITKKELESLQKIKTEVAAVRERAGDLYLQEKQVEDAKRRLDSKLASIKKEELDISIELQKKYGEVNIDLETGAIS
jgi:hypothetical protein|tara:strand:- start:456 stop:701 length:246 start_codon:yes stop_codon:yes gene_type:complete